MIEPGPSEQAPRGLTGASVAFPSLQEGHGQNAGILTLRSMCPAGDGGRLSFLGLFLHP